MKKEKWSTESELPEMKQPFTVSLTMSERLQLIKKYGSLTDAIKTLLDKK